MLLYNAEKATGQISTSRLTLSDIILVGVSIFSRFLLPSPF